MALNLLDARNLNAHDLQRHQPEVLLGWCRKICEDCVLLDDYLKNDFSIHMRRIDGA